MAKRIKSITVAPSDEEDAINEWQTFGWEFKSTQEIITPDSSRSERRGGKVYAVAVPGERYVKLTFERDTAMPHYAQFVELQKMYDSVPSPGNRSDLSSNFSLIILGAGLIFAIWGAAQGREGFAITAAGVVLFFLRIFFHIRRNKRWDADFSRYCARREEILMKAKDFY